MSITKDASASVPTHWYNILADLPGNVSRERRPPSRSGAAADAPTRIVPQLPLTMYRQGLGTDRFVEIPESVRSQYQRWRPTPLIRATRLESFLQTPARIYYKYEGGSPSGSHKLNSALAQAYYYHQAGVRELATGTGAGQWGTALGMACSAYGLRCTVFMVRCSYDQKPGRRAMMELSGASVIPSPSTSTEAGRSILAHQPGGPGSLSIASSEAIQYALDHNLCRYAAGSAESHVLMHQTVIGTEAVSQMASCGEFPDIVVGAIGAGSNFGGLTFPFYRESLLNGRKAELVAVEPMACPTLTRGIYTWDYHDALGSMPMSRMYTLGHGFVPSAIHAGGLRYHGASPIVSWMYKQGLVNAVAYPQRAVFEAGVIFSQTEQIIPAPESAHAIRYVIDKANEARSAGSETVILFCLSGHGLMDLAAYEQYLSGQLIDDDPGPHIADSLRSLADAPV